MVIRLLFLAASVFIALGIITQVILPALLGRSLFPLFRRRESLLQARIAQAQLREAEAETAKREMEAARVETEARREIKAHLREMENKK